MGSNPILSAKNNRHRCAVSIIFLEKCTLRIN